MRSAKCLFIIVAFLSLVIGCRSEKTAPKEIKDFNKYNAEWLKADFSALEKLGCIASEDKFISTTVTCPEDTNRRDEIYTALKDYQNELESLTTDKVSFQDSIMLTTLKSRVFGLSMTYYTPAAPLAPDYQRLTEALYPGSLVDQQFVLDFFKILDLHKTDDPFMESIGPSIPGFSIDEMIFSFMINDENEKVDLAIFNWDIEAKPGFIKDPILSLYYGSPVYLLKGLDKIKIATQESGAIGNFSYITGSNYFVEQIKRAVGKEINIPEEFMDPLPHDQYLSREHPLRVALDARSIILFSPSIKYFYESIPGFDSFSKERIENTDKIISAKGGFTNLILGMMIHESFHAHEGLVGTERDIPEDKEILINTLESSNELRGLMGLYAKIVFSLSDGLIAENVTASDKGHLRDLQVVITLIKASYPNAWNYIRRYEYTEGFAEYVSAYSLVATKIVSLEDKIRYEKEDDSNSFVYRTGAFAGLFLRFKLSKMPFSNGEDNEWSPWEIIIAELALEPSSLSILEITGKYSSYDFDQENEIERIEEYLISSEVEL